MTEFEKELVRFVSGYLDAGVSAEDYVKAFSQRLLDSIGRQSKPNGLSDEDEKTRKELIGQVIYIIPDNSECDNEGNVLPDYEKRIDKYIDFLKRISKPKVCEGLEEEIKRYGKEEMSVVLDSDLNDIARHFAQWQKEKDKVKNTEIARRAINGYKEEMLKDAVEGEVVQDLKGVNRVKSFSKIPEWLYFGDKVKLIIVKEDTK